MKRYFKTWVGLLYFSLLFHAPAELVRGVERVPHMLYQTDEIKINTVLRSTYPLQRISRSEVWEAFRKRIRDVELEKINFDMYQVFVLAGTLKYKDHQVEFAAPTFDSKTVTFSLTETIPDIKDRESRKYLYLIRCPKEWTGYLNLISSKGYLARDI